jgi:hypothetical protein
MLNICIWCQSSEKIGFGHFKRASLVFNTLKEIDNINVKFHSNDETVIKSNVDIFIFDGISVPSFIVKSIMNCGLKILLSPVCDRYDLFDIYLGRPYIEFKDSRIIKYCYEINYEQKNEINLNHSCVNDKSISICFSGGSYLESEISNILFGLNNNSNINKVILPMHYMEMFRSLNFKFEYKVEFVPSTNLWNGEFGKSKYFAGSDGLMIFEALLRRKNIISITESSRSFKVENYNKKNLLDLYLLSPDKKISYDDALNKLAANAEKRAPIIKRWITDEVISFKSAFIACLHDNGIYI